MEGRAPDRITARREAARQRRRARRRRVLAGSLLIAAAVAIAILVFGGDSGSKRGRGASSPPNAKGSGPPGGGSHGGGGHGTLVRNARPQPDWKPDTGPVPILEYHVLGNPIPGAPYPELFVTRPDFTQEMDWLESHGYQAVTLDEVEKAWYHGGTLPAKPVVISFDDGYRPQYTFALPVLRRHGWPGLLNLKAQGSDLYTSNVEAMIAAGWELAAHTIHHLDLTTLGLSQLKLEVAGSRAILRHEYKVPVDNFCYPSGRFDSGVVAAVKAAGYVGATTEIPGDASRGKPYELDRFEILGSTGVSGLAADLSGNGPTGQHVPG
ncbi:MAG TPA: polysaccharide deacetylase family protein [Solirubrobacterales bacterium]